MMQPPPMPSLRLPLENMQAAAITLNNKNLRTEDIENAIRVAEFHILLAKEKLGKL